MKKNIPTTFLIVSIAATLFLTGCTPAKPAALSNAQVVEEIDHILTTIKAGDFQGFTQDFSDAMKSTFTENQFTSLGDLLKKTSGDFVSCEGSEPQLSNSQNYAVYRLNCTFELEKVIVTVTYQINGDQVEGLFFDSTNIRKGSQ